MNRRGTFAVAAGAIASLSATGWLIWGQFERKRARADRRAELKRRIDSIDRLSAKGKFGELGASGFMIFWSDEVVRRLKRARFPLDSLQSRLVAKGTPLVPGASDAEIQRLESRFGMELPRSLKDVYRVSNGIHTYIDYAREQFELLPMDQIRWLREAAPSLVEIWTKERSDPSDERYLKYGPDQDPVVIRTDYLRHMICLSPVVDSGALLLNTALRSSPTEFEAWDFSVKYPGARRYQSLGAMLEQWCEDNCWNLDSRSVTHDLQRRT